MTSSKYGHCNHIHIPNLFEKTHQYKTGNSKEQKLKQNQ
uniref:Uncharacterized protein n=1 Tax=Rhizophora mucronata TaxID=61149 RepID=A0A2P2PNS5_RHIMU